MRSTARRAAYLTSVRQTDVDFTSDVALDTASTGGGAYVSLVGRRVSNGNDYRFMLRYMPGGSVVANLVRTVGNTQTIVATTTVPGLTVSPGDQLRVRFLVGGTTDTTLQAKVWRKGTTGTRIVAADEHRARHRRCSRRRATSASCSSCPARGPAGHRRCAPTTSMRARTRARRRTSSRRLRSRRRTSSSTPSFNASASNDFDGTITSYAWDFGDSEDPTPGTGVTPTHDYSHAGTYTVQLTVTDNSNETATFTDTVTVTDPPPNEPPTASFTSTSQFLNATFDATGSQDSDGTITSYAWDFGDSVDPTPGTGLKPSHRYSEAGTYTVQLTVTDNDERHRDVHATR